VKSPLVWGIHVAAGSHYKNIEDLKGKKAAISRYGSGSHLMAYINAENNNWDLENDLQFEVIRNLNGAIEGLTSGIADYFLWEKFTTKPIVDDGVFRRVGECPSPWPCFVIAVSNRFIEDHEADLKTILDIINNTTLDFKDIPSIDKTISNRYEQQLEDVREWLSITEWSQDVLTQSHVAKIQKELLALQIIPKIVGYDTLVHKLT
jgi:ABC-type nitrate/sulfonate/bicarbonate transport system substrate-binding protein